VSFSCWSSITNAVRTHVLRDLRPYVCTFEDCRQADQLFDTFQSWRLHEIQVHASELAEPLYGKIHEFAGPQGQGRATEDKKDQQVSAHTAGDTRTCPLCLQTGVTAAHVGAHLQRIAIFALPLIQHSGKTEIAEDEDSNEALRSAHVSSATTSSYSGRDPDQPLAQELSISQDGGETSHTRLDDLSAQNEISKHDIISRYLETEEGFNEPSSTFEAHSRARPLPTSLRRSGSVGVNDPVSRLEQTIKIQQQTLAEDDPDRLASQLEFGKAYQTNWQLQLELQLQEELKVSEELLQLNKLRLVNDHPETLNSMHNLAFQYREAGRGAEALKMSEQLFQLTKHNLGEDHPATLDSMVNLAKLLQHQGKYEQAEELNRRVEKVMGLHLPDTLTSVHSLADADTTIDDMSRGRTKKTWREEDYMDEEDERVLYFIPSSYINIEVLVFYLKQFLGDDSDAEPGVDLQVSLSIVKPDPTDCI
jgi:tetratricopeptide (TPR) repeat protein